MCIFGDVPQLRGIPKYRFVQRKQFLRVKKGATEPRGDLDDADYEPP